MRIRVPALKVALASLLVISCAMALAAPALGSGADIWSPSATGGFGTTTNNGTYSMATYGGMLYAGTGNTSTGCEIWRYNGSAWQRVVGRGGTGNTAPGFGDPRNTSIHAMVSWNGFLWVGTNNNPNASPPGTGAEVWRFDGHTWGQANADGFDDPLHNGSVSSMVVFGSYLYAGVYNRNDGCRVYRTSGTGALPVAWSQTNSDGFDLDLNNEDVSSLTVFGGYILAGTLNDDTGCEVFRSDDGHTWFQANADGFGTASNQVAGSFAALGTYLYLGISNPIGAAPAPCRVFRASVGSGLPFSDWTQVNAGGFGDTHNFGAQSLFSDGVHLFVGTYNTYSGSEIWRTAAAGSAPYADWTQSNEDGFGNGDNDEAVWSMAQYETYIFAGTVNILQGARVMRGNLPGRTWYLAEGSTAWGYDAYISIENPHPTAKTARVTYMTGSGAVPGGDVALAPESQTTVSPRAVLGDRDFSTRIDSLDGSVLAVDRTMSWTGTGAPSPEAHSSVGVTAPSTRWYLPEGSSNWGFECFLLIQNPNAGEASCDVTYMIEGGSPRTVNHRVSGNSRATFKMVEEIGSKDASIQVVSSVPVIPERSMYRNNRREGHDSIGTTTPAADYYLAEGTIGWGFTTFVLVQNPQSTATDVTLTYMTSSGSRTASFQMPARSRRTVNVNETRPDLPAPDFSTRVHGSQPIIAERAMYWGAGTALGEACHDSIGMDSAHGTFYLPDGQTSDGRETWTLVQNPNASAVSVRVSYLRQNGSGNVSFTASLPANSRRTYNMSDSGVSGRAAVRVASLTPGKRIMVERAMYWNSRGAGTDTIGGYSD